MHLNVRGIKYLKDKKKVKSDTAVFRCIDVEMFQVKKPLRKVQHIAAQPFSRFNQLYCKAAPETPYRGAPGGQFTFIINFQAPGYCLAMYYQRRVDEEIGGVGGGKAFEASLKAFLEGDEAYRTNHLKFFPVVTEVSQSFALPSSNSCAYFQSIAVCCFFDNFVSVNRVGGSLERLWVVNQQSLQTK